MRISFISLIILAGIAVGCWFAFSRSSNEKNDE